MGLEALIAFEDTSFEARITEPGDLEIVHKPELSVKASGIVPIAVDGT